MRHLYSTMQLRCHDPGVAQYSLILSLLRTFKPQQESGFNCQSSQSARTAGV